MCEHVDQSTNQIVAIHSALEPHCFLSAIFVLNREMDAGGVDAQAAFADAVARAKQVGCSQKIHK